MDKAQINELLYIKKDYSKIIELLQNSDESWSFNILARIYLDKGNIKKAFEIYNKTNNLQGISYCYFLLGETEKAVITITPVREYSSFTKWLFFLFNFINNRIESYPSFLQIKNFYEQDLEMLFKAKQIETIKKIVNKIQYFENYNREIYKYSARVFLNNNCNSLSEMFLKKSIEIFYKDPETHYMLGEIYLRKQDITGAIAEFRKADEIPGGYMPAVNKLKDLPG